MSRRPVSAIAAKMGKSLRMSTKKWIEQLHASADSERLDKINEFMELNRDYFKSLDKENVEKCKSAQFFRNLCYTVEIEAIEDFFIKSHSEFASEEIREPSEFFINVVQKALNLFMQHGSKIIPADKVREICPKRKLIRDEVRNNIKISAKKMAGQYDKRKRIQVKEFSVGDR